MAPPAPEMAPPAPEMAPPMPEMAPPMPEMAPPAPEMAPPIAVEAITAPGMPVSPPMQRTQGEVGRVEGRGGGEMPASPPSPPREEKATIAPPAAVVAGGAVAGQPAGAVADGGADFLGSLAATSPSAYPQALVQARGTVGALHQQQKNDLQASYPVIEKPTGLPRGGKAGGAPTQIPPGDAPDLDVAGSGAATPYSTDHQAGVGAVPGGDVSTAAAEPKAEEGSWWDWLVGRVSGFLGQLPTSDAGVNTSAGERPPVDLSGAADPAQAGQFQQQAGQGVMAQRAQADRAVAADFGENNIYPTVPAEMLQSAYQPGAAGGGGGGIVVPLMPAAAGAALDQGLAGWPRAQVAPQMAAYQQNQMTYAQQSRQARLEGEQRLAAETEQIRAQQGAAQQQAQQGVAARRQQWQEENRQIQAEFEGKATERQSQVGEQIADKVSGTDRAVEEKLSQAENEAATEQQKTEEKAATKKKEYENKPRSFWESVKGGVAAVFTTLRQAVNTLFTELRAFVKKTIEAAKQVVRGLIDMARDTIIGYIKGFGLFLKGLVTVALAAFPETAAQARDWIDRQVDGAVEVVNQAAETLKQIADGILDGVAAGLDAALSAMQAATNLMLDVMEAAVMVQLQLMEMLARLYEMLQPYLPLPEGLRRLANQYERKLARLLDRLAVMLGLKPGAVTKGALGFGGEAAGGGAPISPEALVGQIQASLPVPVGASPSGGGGLPAFGEMAALPGMGGGVVLAAGGGSGGGLGPRMPAGGCGLCYGTPKAAGIAAHNLIQAQFLTFNPFGRKEVTIRAPGDDTPPTGGRLDLAVRTGFNRIEIGEIKPGNTGAVAAGFGQLFFYEEVLKKMLPNVEVGRLRRPVISPMPFPTLSPQPGCTTQSLIVLPPVDGLYAYICKPSFSELMARGCGCQPKKDDEKEKEKEKERKKKEEEEKKKKEKEKVKEIDWDGVREVVATVALIIAILLLIALLIVGIIAIVAPVPEPIHKVLGVLLAIASAVTLIALIARVSPEEETPVA